MWTNSFNVKHCVCKVIPELYVPSPIIQWTKASQVNKKNKFLGITFFPS